MKDYFNVKAISIYLGVHPQTIRRWDREGKLLPHHRTLGNHRRYDLPKKPDGLTIGYVRVSSQDQKSDLVVQGKSLTEKAKVKGIKVDEVIEDIGSGMNYKKKGFRRIVTMLLSGKIRKLVIMHRDRLLRFGAEIIFMVCKHMNVEIEILEESLAKTPVEQLCMDLVEIMTVFTNKIYGMRSKSNLKVLA